MIELIQEIVSAEREADNAVREAREQGTNEKRAAEEVLQSQIAEARAKAKQEAKQRLDEAKQRLDVSHAAKPIDAKGYIEQHTLDIDSLVDEVVDRVLRTEIDQA